MFSLRFQTVTGTSSRILRFHNTMSYSMVQSHLNKCCILLLFFPRSAKSVATILTTLNPLLLIRLGLINWLKKTSDITEVDGIHRLSGWCWNKIQHWGWRGRSTKTRERLRDSKFPMEEILRSNPLFSDGNYECYRDHIPTNYFITLSIIRLAKLKTSLEFHVQQIALKNIFPYFIQLLFQWSNNTSNNFKTNFAMRPSCRRIDLMRLVCYTHLRLASKNDKIWQSRTIT